MSKRCEIKDSDHSKLTRYRICRRCKQKLPITAFSADRTRADFLRNNCRECEAESDKDRYAKRDKIKSRLSDSKRFAKNGNYKPCTASQLEVEAVYTETCMICEKFIGEYIAMDHCHETGKLRGFLCLSCNSKVGWFERNRDKVLTYLGKV